MTELIARCLNTTAPCSGFEAVCASAQHKDRVEQAHMRRYHDPAPTTDEMCDQVTANHSAEHEQVVAAMRACAVVNNGKVDPNAVRELCRDVTPQVLSAAYNVLLRKGRLREDGWTTNTDRAGRNQGKPARTYLWLEDDRSVTA